MRESDFIDAIRESPDDVAPRLVYADWLDDQGDPRGELILLQVEQHTLTARIEFLRCAVRDFFRDNVE